MFKILVGRNYNGKFAGWHDDGRRFDSYHHAAKAADMREDIMIERA